MGKPRPRIAVVIPSWNSVDDLRKCISSLRSQSGVDLEIMVVDNGSSDDSVAFLREDGVPHISLPRNLGFAAAVNLGFTSTESDPVVTLNSDTVLEPNALAEMATVLFSDDRIGGVQPRILSMVRGRERDPLDPEAQIYSLGQALTADGRAREAGIGRRQGELRHEEREIFGVCGAASMFRRAMLSEVGDYDERYFAFYEDVDLNVRARIMGWTFRLVPQAVVWHVGNAAWHAGFDRPDAKNARLVARNRICTQAKFVPLTALPRILAVEIGAVFRAIRGRRFVVTAAGKWAAVLRLPELLGRRRALRESGQLRLAQSWLGQSQRSPLEVLKHPLPPPGAPTQTNELPPQT
jgi:GT2 family glycosyltransferase